MRFSKTVVLLVTVAVFSVMLAANTVHAGVPTATYGVVWTTDSGGNAKITFDFNEKVYIHWVSNGCVNIEVESESSTTYGPWFKTDTSGVIEFTPPEVGYYRITCTGAQVIEIAIGRFFVVPDLPFGTLMAAIACFGALGIIRIKRT